MEEDMTSPFKSLVVVPLAFVSALIAVQPAAAEPAERAVAQCRAELLSRFAQDEIRNYRVASITGNSRRTRVTFAVTADQRYTFECAADARGQILLANIDPPRGGTQLAAGQR
jgi:hypothetical protein